MKPELPISVCVPMYNAARYVRECIESILNQTFADFELLVVDDGSTDGSVEAVRSYDDPRIRLLENEHDYIGSLNLLLEEAKGKYMVRMDADDVMVPDRLQVQFDYMEEHGEIDVLSGGMLYIDGKGNYVLPSVVGRPITVQDMLRGNHICNPTAIMRSESIRSRQLRYEAGYEYAEDYQFWMSAVRAGLHIENLSRIFIEYRLSPYQVSNAQREMQEQVAGRIVRETMDWLNAEKGTCFQCEGGRREELPVSGNELTAIIPFLNEGTEVVRTVESIREFAGDAVDIIVINDASEDGYDYQEELSPYGVRYYFNRERKGVAASRDYGVELCTTPYFILLDAHMRFYGRGWTERIVSFLKRDDRVLLCAQTRSLTKDEQGEVFETSDVPTSFGAYQPLVKTEYWPDIDWNNVERCPGSPEEDIPLVLGAGYAASKRYWTYLRGLEGLVHYGSDEAYISLKVWREGGRCVLLKDVVIGHVYRMKAPYRMYSEKQVFNSLLISSLLYPQSLRILSFTGARLKCPETYRKALGMLAEEEKHILELKACYRTVFTRSYRDIAPWLKIIQPDALNYARTCTWTFPLVEKDIECRTEGYGICEGKMAAVLWLFEYAAFSGNSECVRRAQRLVTGIEDALEAGRIPLNFGHGLCGIGWGLLYLSENNYPIGNVEKLLEKIDGCLLPYAPGRCGEDSLATGLTGLLCYATARLRNRADAFDPVFRQELLAAAQRLRQYPCDRMSLYYASLYVDMAEQGADPEDIPISLGNWMDFPHFIPRNPEHWQYSLPQGIIGASLIALLILDHAIKK